FFKTCNGDFIRQNIQESSIKPGDSLNFIHSTSRSCCHPPLKSKDGQKLPSRPFFFASVLRLTELIILAKKQES
ncbi:MAG: hypothetical protein D6714_00955, partial [Bacteroidetes bacterium]